MEDRDMHYNAAITVDMFEHTYFNFSFGVTYLQKGGVDKSVMSTDETGAELYRIEVANRLDYVCFSPAIKLKYDFGVFVPFIIVGPSLDVQVAKKDSNLGYVLENFKKYEISLPFGVGVGYKLNRKFKIDVNVQYQPSVTDAFENDHVTITNFLFKYNIGVQLLL